MIDTNHSLIGGVEARTPHRGSGRYWHRVLEPQISLPGLGIFLLVIMWAGVLRLVDTEYSAAQQRGVALTERLADTYEAQVVRALREINQSMRTVQFAYRGQQADAMLAELEAKNLLLPSFLFTTAITDSGGNIVASTREDDVNNIADKTFFREQLSSDRLSISEPVLDRWSEEWMLSFSRRLETPNGEFAGVVLITVTADYFASGYEFDQYGHEGAVALIGNDGVTRVRRSGELTSAGDLVELDHLLSSSDDDLESSPVRVLASPWDGRSRYTRVTRLFEFPLVVLAGLSESEQLENSAAQAKSYMERATLASIGGFFVIALFAWQGWQLQKSRRQAMEEQVEHARRVEHLAYHDSLTGLPNRSYFSRLVSHSLAEAKRYDRKVALLFLDLDRFKIINDTLGHDAGDELLIEVAKRLRASLRESDTVARLGGDEFVVLIPESNDQHELSEVARKILSAVGQPFTLAGQQYRVTVSIGISVFPHDGEDEQTLSKNADIAMYHAKESGKNNFRFYSKKLDTDSLERLTLESSLRQALEREEFRIHYQHKRSLESGEICGTEALLRWQHPSLGLILPMQFIPLAEETGLILPIGRWVMEKACKQAVAWQENGEKPRILSINLTARQFRDDQLLSNIGSVLDKTGLDPRLLELEITESTLLSDLDKSISVLDQIKSLGVRIAVDNFGTSYSVISALEAFHFDSLKIDGSLIRDIADQPADRELTEAVISVGRTMANTIVAEGVETQAQAEFLRSSSCDQVQGYFFDKPVPESFS